MDSSLRRLERAYRTSGALQDETAWLAERARVGELTSSHIELAAVLLHPAAKRVLGADDPLVRWTDTVGVWNLERWLRKLSAWGLLPLTRAVIAAGRRVTRPGDPPAVRRTLEAAEAWVLRPRPAELRRLVRAGKRVQARVSDPARVRHVAWMAQSLAQALELGQAPTRAALWASKLGDPVEVRLAMCDEVTRWVLGYGDPLAERVRERAG